MKVSQRLYLAILPSVVGMMTLAALAYWGQYARAIPALYLLVAVMATIATFVLSWTNVRYVAARVEGLVRETASADAVAPSLGKRRRVAGGPRDELDLIAGTVNNLSGAVQAAEVDHALDVARIEQRMREQVEVLAVIANSALQRLDEIRLPLHILLENHFGDLNENQEEMLGAARTASEGIEAELSAISDYAALENGNVELRRDRAFPADMMKALLPTLRAHAATKRVDLQSSFEPLVPPLHVDAARLQQATLILLSDAVGGSGVQKTGSLSLRDENHAVQIVLEPARPTPHSARTLMARRIVEMSGGIIAFSDNKLELRFPH